MKKRLILVFLLLSSFHFSYGDTDPLRLPARATTTTTDGLAGSPNMTGPTNQQKFIQGIVKAMDPLQKAGEAVSDATGGGDIISTAINVPLTIMEVAAQASSLAGANWQTTDWASLLNDVTMFGHNLVQLAQQTALAERQVRTLMQSKNAQDVLRTGSSMVAQYYKGFGPINALIQQGISNYEFATRVFKVLGAWSLDPNFPAGAISELASLTTSFIDMWVVESTALLNMVFDIRDRTVDAQIAAINEAIRRSNETKAIIAARIAALHGASIRGRQRTINDNANRYFFAGFKPKKLELKSRTEPEIAADITKTELDKLAKLTPNEVAKTTFTSGFWSQLIHIVQMLIGLMGAIYLLVNYFLKGKHDPQHHDSMFKVFIGLIIAIILLIILSEVIIPMFGQSM